MLPSVSRTMASDSIAGAPKSPEASSKTSPSSEWSVRPLASRRSSVTAASSVAR